MANEIERLKARLQLQRNHAYRQAGPRKDRPEPAIGGEPATADGVARGDQAAADQPDLNTGTEHHDG
jgi:hypothetical protein